MVKLEIRVIGNDEIAGSSPANSTKEVHMKPYGHSRRDKLECPYGCCTSKSGKGRRCRKAVDRAHRKTARQSNKKESLVEDEIDR